jgi:Arc/MetJ-type ribon-helix-helix transcriptional regulator
MDMSTTTVRLDEADESMLDRLAPTFGGRSNTIREALRHLAAEVERQESLAEFLADWDRESDPVAESDLEAMAARFGL